MAQQKRKCQSFSFSRNSPQPRYGSQLIRLGRRVGNRLWIYDHNNVDDVDSAATPTMDKADAQQTRFRKLFDKLDINKDGRIEAGELATALRASSAAISEDDVKVFAKVRSQLACFGVVRLPLCPQTQSLPPT